MSNKTVALQPSRSLKKYVKEFKQKTCNFIKNKLIHMCFSMIWTQVLNSHFADQLSVAAYLLWSDLDIFIFNLGRVCFSPFLICRSPTVRSCCSRFDNSEVIFRGCDYIITANLSFHSKFQDEIIQRKKESEAATGVVLGKRDVPKNSCSESYQAKFAVKIREKYLQSS